MLYQGRSRVLLAWTRSCSPRRLLKQRNKMTSREQDAPASLVSVLLHETFCRPSVTALLPTPASAAAEERRVDAVSTNAFPAAAFRAQTPAEAERRTRPAAILPADRTARPRPFPFRLALPKTPRRAALRELRAAPRAGCASAARGGTRPQGTPKRNAPLKHGKLLFRLIAVAAKTKIENKKIARRS